MSGAAPNPQPISPPDPTPTSGGVAPVPDGLAAVHQRTNELAQAARHLASIKDPTLPTLEALPKAPTLHPQEIMGGLSQWGTILAIFGSMLTRQPMTAALNAAASGMRAYQAGNAAGVKDARQTYMENLQRALAHNKELNQQYIDALERGNFDIAKVRGQMTAIASANHDSIALAALETNHADKMAELVQQRAIAGAHLAQIAADMHYKDAALKIKALSTIATMKENGLTIPPEIYDEAGITPPAPGAAGTAAPTEGPMDKIARDVAEYKFAPSAFALARPQWLAIMAKVARLNPTWNMGTYNARISAAKAFYTGKQGDQVRSFNAALAHLDLLDGLAKALDNKDMPLVNRASLALQQQFGDAAPTNFDAAKQIVGQEVVKAIVPGGGGEAERLAAAQMLNRANSWDQLAGVIHVVKGLMAGQLHALARQYQASTGQKDFDLLLGPEARALFSEGNGTTPVARADQPEGTIVEQDGVRYRRTNGAWMALH
jgi:hypothetical protein